MIIFTISLLTFRYNHNLRDMSILASIVEEDPTKKNSQSRFL